MSNSRPAMRLVDNSTPGKRLANFLMVDDNESDITLAQIALLEEQQMQCNLFVARDAGAALELLKDAAEAERPIDLMLLDINMPGADGFMLLEQIRRDEALADIRVVMCSTSTSPKDLDRARELGVIGYLLKPPSFARLEAIVAINDGLEMMKKEGSLSLLRAAS